MEGVLRCSLNKSPFDLFCVILAMAMAVEGGEVYSVWGKTELILMERLVELDN